MSDISQDRSRARLTSIAPTVSSAGQADVELDDIELGTSVERLELTTDIPSLAELLATTVVPKHIDLSSPSSSSYLAHLSSLPLPSLLAEPSLIAHESSSVESELTNLCYREYGTFVSIHECSSAVASAFDDFSTSLDGLLASVPSLEAECRAFADSSIAIQRERRKAIIVQEHQDKLLDVLEIPRLMDTCVRNGYYTEALELEAHARDLVQRYGDIPLVQDVAHQVERVRQLMLAQLLALLREPVKLPTLVKAVNFLRRMGMHESLSMAFLISRQHNLRTQLVSIEKDRTDPTRYVRRYVDIFREHVYDIISQYTAIFLDVADVEHQADARELTTFAHSQLEALLALLDAFIPKITDPASLSSILIQLGYCALSFARVGIDFADLVVKPFERAVIKSFTDACTEAESKFGAAFKNAIRTGATPSELLMLQEHSPELDAFDQAEVDITQPPPVASYPPIATLLNGHINALNALRLLAPHSLHRTLSAIQTASLNASSKTLLSFIQLATSDHPPLPPVSLSRSNSQTKQHSRHPSASLRRRATGLGQAAGQNKICIAATKAFFCAVGWLVNALERGVYEALAAGVDDRPDIGAELKEWLRNAAPAPAKVVNDAFAPIVDNHPDKELPTRSEEDTRAVVANILESINAEPAAIVMQKGQQVLADNARSDAVVSDEAGLTPAIAVSDTPTQVDASDNVTPENVDVEQSVVDSALEPTAESAPGTEAVSATDAPLSSEGTRIPLNESASQLAPESAEKIAETPEETQVPSSEPAVVAAPEPALESVPETAAVPPTAVETTDANHTPPVEPEGVQMGAATPGEGTMPSAIVETQTSVPDGLETVDGKALALDIPPSGGSLTSPVSANMDFDEAAPRAQQTLDEPVMAATEILTATNVSQTADGDSPADTSTPDHVILKADIDSLFEAPVAVEAAPVDEIIDVAVVEPAQMSIAGETAAIIKDVDQTTLEMPAVVEAVNTADCDERTQVEAQEVGSTQQPPTVGELDLALVIPAADDAEVKDNSQNISERQISPSSAGPGIEQRVMLASESAGSTTADKTETSSPEPTSTLPVPLPAPDQFEVPATAPTPTPTEDSVPVSTVASEPASATASRAPSPDGAPVKTSGGGGGGGGGGKKKKKNKGKKK